MAEIITALAVVLFIFVLEEVSKDHERKAWNQERASLLDRIMSTNYQQYVDAQAKVKEIAARTGGKVEVITVEELEQRLQSEGSGIPV